jgi:anti-anti-sigma regulatory factor
MACRWQSHCIQKFVNGFRIEKIAEVRKTILRISGQIAAEHIPQLKAEIEGDDNIALDLENVTLVNGEVVQFLLECELKAIELRNCPPYIRQWIRTMGNDLETGID